MSESLVELRGLSDDEIIRKHDRHAERTRVGTQHYLDELSRRDHNRQTIQIKWMTAAITFMTVVILVATVVNVVFFIARG